MVCGPRAEPYARPVRTNGVDDSPGNLEHEAHAVLHRATIRIRPLIRIRLQKLVREIPVRRVDLHAVEPGPEHGVPSSQSIQLYILPDLFYRQRARHGWRRGIVGGCREWDWAGRDDRVVAFFLEDVWGCGAAERIELEEDERPVFMHLVYDLPRRSRRAGRGTEFVRSNLSASYSSISEGTTNRQPPLDLLVTPYARDVPVPARLRSNHRPLGDGQGSGDTRALLVVFHGERPRDVLRICAEACHGGQHNAVLEVGGADANRLEEFRNGGDGHGLLESRKVREEMAVQ